MKHKKNINLEKITKLEKLKSLSKTQLETIIGGPETSRGTSTRVDG